jgi:translation initiation factor IF-1
MPNLIGGKNYKKGKKGGRKNKNPTEVFDVTDGVHYYAQVIQKLGHNRLSLKLQTGETIQGVIPGKFMKKVWFNKEDFIVVRHEGGEFYDVIQKLTAIDQIEAAANSIGVKLNKDDYNIYNLDDINEDDDEDVDVDVLETTDNAAQKSIFRQREKERDLARRKNRDVDDFDRVIAVANSSSESDDNSTEEVVKPSTKNVSSKESSENDDFIDDI